MLYYKLDDIVTLKKGHPCGENKWQIKRTGADIKLECLGCGRLIWMSRMEFEKRARKILEGKKFVSIVHHKKDDDKLDEKDDENLDEN